MLYESYYGCVHENHLYLLGGKTGLYEVVARLLHITPKIQCVLRTFIPFRQVRNDDEGNGIIMGVIEIEKDLSANYTNISYNFV